MLLFVILTGAWLLFAGSQLVRVRDQRRSVDSVGAFHRQLRVLERTMAVPGHNVRLHPAVSVGRLHPPASAAMRSIHTTLPPEAQRRPPGGPVGSSPSADARPRRPVPRTPVQQRRVAVLRTLLIVSVGTLLLCAVPVLRPVLVLHAVIDVLLVAYVFALVRIRKAALERERKVRFLPSSPGPVGPAPVESRSAIG